MFHYVSGRKGCANDWNDEHTCQRAWWLASRFSSRWFCDQSDDRWSAPSHTWHRAGGSATTGPEVDAHQFDATNAIRVSSESRVPSTDLFSWDLWDTTDANRTRRIKCSGRTTGPGVQEG